MDLLQNVLAEPLADGASGDLRKTLSSAFLKSLDSASLAPTLDEKLNGDLNETGTWNIQSKATIPAGTFRSDISTFKVYENL